MAEAWSVEVRVVRVVQAGWPCRRCSMSLLREGSMRRQTWHILGWPGVRLVRWSFWRLGACSVRAAAAARFMPTVSSRQLRLQQGWHEAPQKL